MVNVGLSAGKLTLFYFDRTHNIPDTAIIFGCKSAAMIPTDNYETKRFKPEGAFIVNAHLYLVNKYFI